MNLGNIKNIFAREPVQGPQQNPAAKPAADKKVEAPAAKAVEVANVSLNRDLRPSKASRAWTFTKEQSPRIAYGAALIAAVAMVAFSGGLASPLAIAGYALAGTAILGAGIYETSRKRNIDKLAKEFHKAIIAFDKAETQNEKATARVRLQNARNKLLGYVKNNSTSVEDLRAISKRIASANSNKNFRIDNKEILNELIDPKYRVRSGALTFGALVEDMINGIVRQVAKETYNRAIKSKAKEIASLLKGNKGEAKKARFKLIAAAREIHGDNTYVLAGRKFKDVMDDLANEIKENLGGEKAIKKELARLEDLMKNNVKFYNEIANNKNKISKEFSKEFKKLDAEIKAQKNAIEKLEIELAVLGREREISVNIINKDQATTERLEVLAKKLVENKNKQDELKAKKEALVNSKKAKEEELKAIVAKLAEDLAININAKRHLLSQLIGEEKQRAPLAMPNTPNWRDKGKFYGKRIVIGGAGLGVAYGAYRIGGQPTLNGLKFVSSWGLAAAKEAGSRAMPYTFTPLGEAATEYGPIIRDAFYKVGGYLSKFGRDAAGRR